MFGGLNVIELAKTVLENTQCIYLLFPPQRKGKIKSMKEGVARGPGAIVPYPQSPTLYQFIKRAPLYLSGGGRDICINCMAYFGLYCIKTAPKDIDGAVFKITSVRLL